MPRQMSCRLVQIRQRMLDSARDASPGAGRSAKPWFERRKMVTRSALLKFQMLISDPFDCFVFGVIPETPEAFRDRCKRRCLLRSRIGRLALFRDDGRGTIQPDLM